MVVMTPDVPRDSPAMELIALQHITFASQQGSQNPLKVYIREMPKPSKLTKSAEKPPVTVFPAPDHDHARCSSDAMAAAEAVCAGRGQRLTPIRKEVLGALLASHKPLGAYEIIDHIPGKESRPAPITIYRALEFLMENGLVHRIESRNAFVACVHNHGEAELVIFLLCDRCGSVGEAPSTGVAAALKSASRDAGFSARTPVIEISGTCSHCREA